MSAIEERARPGLTLQGSLVLFFGAIGFLIGRRVLGDNSFLTHFATGQLIIDRGSVPTVDPYSFTAKGEPWVVQSWLASVLYAGVDGVLGGFGVRLMNGVLTGATAALVWKMTSRRNANVFVPLGLTGAVLIIGASMWSARPLLFGLLGFTLVLAVLEGLIRPLWLLPIMWVWVNSHGSFPLAGVLVGTVGVGQWLDSRQFPVDTARVLGYVTAGTLLGAINPLGPRLLWFPVQLLGRGEALDNVVEWRPFTLEGITAWVFAGLIVAFVVSLTRTVEWRNVVPATVFTLAAFLAIRNIVVASVVLAVVAAPHLQLTLGQLRHTDRGPAPRILGVGSIALALLAVVASMSGSVDFDGYPIDEIDALDEAGLFDGNHRVLHSEVVGNYLGFRFGTDANVFVDDRFDFYPQQVLDDFDVMLYGGDYQAVVDRWEPDAILWKQGGGFQQWLEARGDWVVDDPLEIVDGQTGETQESDWFLAWPSVATPSPEVLAANP
ncbi:MAG: hypothetical protein HKN24_12720 [Acidimicrobiales bacterium]|nr:hypothetical protein [Acidimicrobiales bacterium]